MRELLTKLARHRLWQLSRAKETPETVHEERQLLCLLALLELRDPGVWCQ